MEWMSERREPVVKTLQEDVEEIVRRVVREDVRSLLIWRMVADVFLAGACMAMLIGSWGIVFALSKIFS